VSVKLRRTFIVKLKRVIVTGEGIAWMLFTVFAIGFDIRSVSSMMASSA
jgi:hypothetical protein